MKEVSFNRDSSLASTLLGEVQTVSQAYLQEAMALPPTPPNMLRLHGRISSLVDQKLTILAQQKPANACQKGCSDCCHSAVPSTAIEALAIAETIRREWHKDDISVLIEELKEITAEMDADFDLWAERYRRPCPLLIDGECSVYKTRPLWCRTATSWNKELCACWRDSQIEVGELPSVHGERMIMEAANKGIASQAPEMARTLPLAFHLLGHFSPSDMPDQRQRPTWLPPLPPAPKEEDRVLVNFFTNRDERGRAGWPQDFNPSLLAHRLAALDIAVSYSKPGQQEEDLAWYENQLDEIAAAKYDDIPQAFQAIQQLRFVRLGYGRLYPKAIMSKVGDVIQSKVTQPLAPALLEPLGKRKAGKPRVAFLSTKLGRHSGSSWALPLFKLLDRSQFETYAICAGIDRDRMTLDFRDHADHFYSLNGDRLAMAKFVKDLDLDYLLFTDIGDMNGNLQLAMFRMARIQAAGWGCPFSSGMPQVDEYISAELWETPTSDSQYREKLVRLPLHGLTYDRPNYALKDYNREDFGLPTGHLVNIAQNLAKWRPEDDQIYAEIADKLENPLYVFEAGPTSAVRLFKERMAALNARITYVPRTQNAVYLRMIGLFDLTLDAPSFHGGHSSFTALGAGTPALSLVGDQLRSRMGLAFQTMANIPGAAVTTIEDYIQKATDKHWAAKTKAEMNTDALFGNPEPAKAFNRHVLTVVSP